nr:ABC transporter ATP-binding protein [Lachnospiraceae bacterium]
MVKKLASYIKEYKAPSIATPICMIFEVLFEILIPMLMASIVNDGINKGDMGHIYRTGALMVLFAVCGLVSGILGGVFAAKAATGFAKNLRKALFDRVQDFSFHNIDHFSTAGLVTRLTTDVTNIQNSYQVLLRM